jgi:OOP family OmpA-OmpF porin
MCKPVTAAILHSLIFLTVRGQEHSFTTPRSLGVHIFVLDFTHSDSLYTPGGGHSLKAGLAINYLAGVSPRLDLNTTLAGSFLNYTGKGSSGSSQRLFLEADVSLRERLLSGYHVVTPFLQAGPGISRYNGQYGLLVPAGMGIQVNFKEEAFLLIQAQYRIPLSANQSGHFYFSAGIDGIIGKKKRKSRHLILPVSASRHEPAVVSSDQKDSDGDGIPDREDKCPLIAGVVRYQGCPVPDRDKDGVNDEQDKCPDLPGSVHNEGCPMVKEDILRKVEGAAKNVFFETDSYLLLPASYKALDEVAGIMRKNPFLRLDIEGHTDNSGTPEKNQILSERRAASVLDYLAGHGGIERQRLAGKGFGSTQPIADNSTENGRALNRRVEFKLRYY